MASYIGISTAGVPEEAFMPAFLSATGLNIVLSYIISFFVGWFIPSEKLGFAFAGKCGLKPSDGIKFGLVLNIVVNSSLRGRQRPYPHVRERHRHAGHPHPDVSRWRSSAASSSAGSSATS